MQGLWHFLLWQFKKCNNLPVLLCSSAPCSVYTTLILAPALGCWLLAAQLAGRMYDAMSAGGSSDSMGYNGLQSSLQPPTKETAAAAAALPSLVGAKREGSLGSSLDLSSSRRSIVRKLLQASSSSASRTIFHADATWWWFSLQVVAGAFGHVAQPHAHEGLQMLGGVEEDITDGPACLGPECFRLTFFVLAALCGGAAVAAARLLRRTRACYTRLLNERLIS